MSARTKIVDEDEARRWYFADVTYGEFVRRYREMYSVETTEAMWSSWRRRSGFPRRAVRDEELIPWAVSKEHRFMAPLTFLRLEAQRRAGRRLTEYDATRLSRWLDQLQDLEVVVTYEPDTEEGFFYVPREDDDTDIVRQPPPEHRTQRGNAG